MAQQKWVWTAITCLCAVGCGGRAQEDVQGSDSGPPPAGFYSVSYESLSDLCQPLHPQSTAEELVGSTANGPNIWISQGDTSRQDIGWGQPFMYTWSECGTSITLDVTAKTSHSFVVDSLIDWVNPGACPLVPPSVPSSDCTVHQRETFELEQACPATRNGISCE
jgi:hypothetical protein